MRILYAGTPEIAVPSLQACHEFGQVVGVLTNPDRPKGRGKKMIPSPVKEKAIQLDLKVFQPEKLDEAFISQVKELDADILVCVAFGKIFRKEFLDVFPLGGINLHPSALPKFRGPSPLSAAIMDGLDETSITVQRLALKMDSGDILIQEPLVIDPQETTETLTQKAGEKGAPLLIEALKGLKDHSIQGMPQKEEDASYCSLLAKKDGMIDWQKEGPSIDRQIRACHPWPGAFTSWKDQVLFIRKASIYQGDIPGQNTPGKVIGVDKAKGILIETGKGILQVERLQIQSRKNLDYKSFLNGNQDFLNSELGV